MDFTAILATIIFCAVGPVGPQQKCDDRTPAKQWNVHILQGEGEPAHCDEKERGTLTFCAPRMGELKTVLKITEGQRVIFSLRPDGSTEHAPDFNPDLAAKAFWYAIFAVYPNAAKMWNVP